MNKFLLTFEYIGKAESWEQIRNDAENNKIPNVFIGAKEFVNVVRCKDCKFSSAHSQWCRRLSKMTSDSWFCGDGKRKEERE